MFSKDETSLFIFVDIFISSLKVFNQINIIQWKPDFLSCDEFRRFTLNLGQNNMLRQRCPRFSRIGGRNRIVYNIDVMLNISLEFRGNQFCDVISSPWTSLILRIYNEYWIYKYNHIIYFNVLLLNICIYLEWNLMDTFAILSDIREVYNLRETLI